MSTLLLVRHAQASFLEPEYDKLSELGELQARLLGESWAGLGLGLDAVLVGPRERHRATATHALAELSRRGLAVPALTEVAELDEYPADEVLGRLLPSLADRADIAELMAQTGSDDRRVRGRALDRLLQVALRSWVDSAAESVEHVTWVDFIRRVQTVLDGVMARTARGERIAAFSSAGTIGAMVGQMLGADRHVALELGWMLNNSAVTEVAFSPGRATLSRFNVVAHLPDPAHWTRR